MDIACFRWSCELVSGRAEVASTGAEDLGLGVVCVGGGKKQGEGGGKCLEFAAKWFTFREEQQTRNGRSGYG